MTTPTPTPAWLPQFQEDPSRLLNIVEALSDLSAKRDMRAHARLTAADGSDGPALVIAVEPAGYEEDDE